MTPRRHLDRRLKLSFLRVADALAVRGSLVAAAAALGIGQPALSRTLREMEEVVGARLFERHARGVRPTAEGAVVVRLARRVLAELRRAEEELDAAAGTVAVGALPVAAVGVLPGVLIRLKAANPGLTVRLESGRTEELLPLLATGDLDLVVGRLYPPAAPDGFVREALWDEPVSVLARAGHPLLAAGRAVAPDDLAAYDLLLPTVSQRVGVEIEGALTALGLSRAEATRSASYGLIREMLLATDHLAVMPLSMMLGDLLRGALRVVPLPVPAPPRPAGLILRPGALPPPAAAFVAALRAYLADIGPAAMPEPDTSRRKSDSTPRRRHA